MIKNINELAREVHQAHIKWWQDPVTQAPITRDPFELLALVISELSEALEGERKNLMDDHIPSRKMAEVEMADAKIRLLDFAGGFNLVIPLSRISAYTPRSRGEFIFKIMRVVTRIAPPFNGEINTELLCISIAMIEDYCRIYGYDLDQAMTEKLEYNLARKDHSHEARVLVNGKKF